MTQKLNVAQRSTTVHSAFVGEGYYDLRLGIGQLQDLEELLGAGPAELLTRFRASTWRVNDLKQTIRLGLIGAGMSPQEAFGIVERNLKEGYLLDYLLLATTLVGIALVGPETDPVGEPEAATTPETETMPSAGQPSTSSAAPPDTPQSKFEK